MLIGFSGSRHGPFPRQKITFQRTLFGLIKIAQTVEPRDEPLLFRHGDCLGWDDVAHDIAAEVGFSIIVHPPINPKLRAFKPSLIPMPPKDYLPRNRDIVDGSERMIICPDTPEYKIKSGSWYTWKYAIARGIDTLLIQPDGTVRFEVGKTPQTW